MIKINLLPSEGAKRATASKARAGSGSGAFAPVALLMLLVLAGLGFYGYTLYGQYSAAEKKVLDAKRARDTVQNQVKNREKDFESQLRFLQDVEEKFAVVQALTPPDRVFWSEKLNMIAAAQRQAAVYIDKMQLLEKIEEVETEESRKRMAEWEAKNKATPGGTKDPKPQVIKQPIIYQTLNLDAMAYGVNSPQRLQQITLFYDALRKMEWTRKSGERTRFIAGLESEFTPRDQKLDVVGGVEVMRFGFTIPARGMTAKTTGVTTGTLSLLGGFSTSETTGTQGGGRGTTAPAQLGTPREGGTTTTPPAGAPPMTVQAGAPS